MGKTNTIFCSSLCLDFNFFFFCPKNKKKKIPGPCADVRQFLPFVAYTFQYIKYPTSNIPSSERPVRLKIQDDLLILSLIFSAKPSEVFNFQICNNIVQKQY